MRWLVPLTLVLVPWILVTSLGWVKSVILPSPWSVVKALPGILGRDRVWVDMCRTLARVAAALVLAVAFGVPVGLWLGYHRQIYRLIEGPIHALRSLPAAALFPLFLIVIGVDESSIVALATYNSLLVVMINTIVGAGLANQHRLYQARLLRLNAWVITTQILFWEALPHILAGIRIAVSYGLALVIAVEMFIGISQVGLGRRIFDFQAAYRIPETYASIILTGILGAGINGCLTLVERKLLRWLPSAGYSNER